ncbi:hypothetical protein [Streptomyces flavidovirens]|uniref:Uncharacterized protein n=1 Tax=Streptomyces flavidovirens TaxID=67298 RepID=A0ABW6RAR0_9ACTN
MHAYNNSRQTIANPAYGPVLWRDEPADELFPDHLGRKDGGGGDVTKPEKQAGTGSAFHPTRHATRG